MGLATVEVNATDLNASALQRLLPALASSPRPSLRRVGDFLRSVAGGVYRGSVRVRAGTVKATATLVFSSTGPADTQTVSICGTTFTAATTPSGANDFQRSDTPATAAAALVALINTVSAMDRPKVNASVVATLDSATITLTARDSGQQGNGLHVAAVGTFANVVITNFAGGSDGTQTDLSVG